MGGQSGQINNKSNASTRFGDELVNLAKNYENSASERQTIQKEYNNIANETREYLASVWMAVFYPQIQNKLREFAARGKREAYLWEVISNNEEVSVYKNEVVVNKYTFATKIKDKRYIDMNETLSLHYDKNGILFPKLKRKLSEDGITLSSYIESGESGSGSPIEVVVHQLTW